MNKRRISKRLREAKAFEEFHRAIDADARSHNPKLRVGKKFGRGLAQIIVTRVGTHTVSYDTGDGYHGSIQIPWIGADGEQLPSHKRALREAGES